MTMRESLGQGYSITKARFGGIGSCSRLQAGLSAAERRVGDVRLEPCYHHCHLQQ